MPPGPRGNGGGGFWGARRVSMSADIAIERPAPSYPTTKKSEGKILRPQYKEILTGEFGQIITITYTNVFIKILQTRYI